MLLVKFLYIYMENIQPVKPLKSNFANRQYIQATTLHAETTGMFTRCKPSTSSQISPKRDTNLVKLGAARVELKFGAALANTMTVVAYVEFENVIEINRNRNIVYDFGS